MLHSEYDAMEGAAEMEFCQSDGSIIAEDETIIQFLISEGFERQNVLEFMTEWKKQDE